MPGVKWEHEVMQAIQESHLVILLLSSRSVSKVGFIQKEIHEALDRLQYFPPGRLFLIPARIDDCEPKHRELKGLQWVDLFPDHEKGLKKILLAIQQELPKEYPLSIPVAENVAEIETLLSTEMVLRRLNKKGNLLGCDMMDLDLTGINFRGVDLRGANLVRCILKNADFSDADLSAANLERGQLINAKLSHANLWGVNLWKANLRNVQELQTANLEHANCFGLIATTDVQHAVLKKHNTTEVDNYYALVDYFHNNVGLSLKEISETFVWLNHRYFRLFFKGDIETALRSDMIRNSLLVYGD